MNFKFITVCACALVFLFLITSCEKEEATEPTQVEASDNNSQMEGSEQDFHMHFDATMTEEEADAAWEKALASRRASKELMAKPPTGYTNVLAVYVKTKTGTGKYDGTDDHVHINVKFKLDDYSPIKTIVLNNKGDDREGGWDYYIGGTSVGLTHAAQIEEATLQLEGTDGWGVERYVVRLRPNDQIVDTQGWSELIATERRVLDQDHNSGAYYKKGYYTGIVTFH